MGTEYSCQTVESEEETVNRIFRIMFKKEIKTESIYENYLKCVIYYPNLKKLKLNKKLFSHFLNYVLEDNPYVEIYKEYFSSLIQEYNEIESVRKIGLVIIEYAIGDNCNSKLKKKLYFEHFKKFYLENISEKAEKDASHFTFALGNENNFYSSWTDENKDPNSDLFLLKKPNSAELDIDKNLSSIDVDKIIIDYYKKTNSDDSINKKPNKKNESATIDDSYNYDFYSSNFNFNAKQNPNFIGFLKKKELENLDNQIILFVSDVIENNTNCLSNALKGIFSGMRLETLEKSWGKNNKRLLLYEIHRNYTSLVEKICLFPTFDPDDSFKRKSNQQISPSYEIVQNVFTPKHISSKTIKIDKFNEQFEFERLDSEEEVSKKTKIHKEMQEFFQNKEKLIKNFFELTETQLSGDAIRNWLYENSKN